MRFDSLSVDWARLISVRISSLDRALRASNGICRQHTTCSSRYGGGHSVLVWSSWEFSGHHLRTGESGIRRITVFQLSDPSVSNTHSRASQATLAATAIRAGTWCGFKYFSGEMLVQTSCGIRGALGRRPVSVSSSFGMLTTLE